MDFSLTQRFLDFALLGAEWVLWLLVFLSIASVYVMIERFMVFRDAGARGKWERPFFEAVGDGDLGKAQQIVDNHHDVAARLIAPMLARYKAGRVAMVAAMESARSEERVRLETNLSVLGTLGANAPFIGLFGTVLGIMQAFKDLSTAGVTMGAEQSAIVMTGISEALVATAVGLLVAIPAVVAYNLFQRRAKSTLAHADALVSRTLSLLNVETEA